MTDTLREPGGCLDAETLAALVDGRLTAAERERAERHLASCEECHAVFLDVVTTWRDDTPAVPASATGPAAAQRRPYVMAAGLLAVAAGVVLAIWLPGYLAGRHGSRPELRALVAAAGSTRTLEARLTGGFAWGVLDTSVRGGTRVEPSADVDAAAAALRQAVERDRSAANLAAFGSSRLVVGRIDEGVAALEEATRAEAGRADYWSDLAAAYLAQSEQPGRESAVKDALDASNTAVALDRSLPEALFNRAVALERLKMNSAAMEAWKAYLASSDSPEWQAEGRRRLEALERAPAAPSGGSAAVGSLRQALFGSLLRAWVEAPSEAARLQAFREIQSAAAAVDRGAKDAMARDVIAALERAGGAHPTAATVAAHRAFLTAIVELDREDFDVAREKFASARGELARLGSPLALTAGFHEGVIDYRRENGPDAVRRFARVRAESEVKGYSWLVGHAEWMLGLMEATEGHHREAKRHYEAALAAFDAAGDTTRRARVMGLLATNADAVGDFSRGWTLRLAAIRENRTPGVLLTAALAASTQGSLRAALDFARAGGEAARAADSPPNIADALRVEASIRARLGDRDGVATLIQQARAMVATRREQAWDRVRAEIALAEAQSVDSGQTDLGIQAAGQAIDYFASQNGLVRLPELYAIRARLERQAGRPAHAKRDVESGLAILDRLRARLPGSTDQASFEAVERDLISELVILSSDEEIDSTFGVLDRHRGRDIVSTPPPTLQAIQALLPSQAVLTAFVVTESASFAWTVTSRDRAFHRIDAGQRELADLVRAVTPPRRDPAAAAALRRLLLHPIETRWPTADEWIVIPDGPLRALAFSLLPLPGGLPFVVSRSLVVAPSAGSWLQATSRLPRHGARSVLAVGNPDLDRAEYPDLLDLPHAVAEAEEISAFYPASRTLLRGPEATRDAMLAAMDQADVLHFAGHAVINPWVADASYLALSGPVPSKITAADVRERRLARSRLAVLAACDTAGGGPVLSSPLSLSRAFLAAGVSNVVGSLWPVSDRATRTLFSAFHAEYARSGDAARALQKAQASLATSPDATLSDPRQWAAFVVMGGSAGIDVSKGAARWESR